MRTAGGGYTIHQSLSSEAATIVKQALTLARRRGHAQVTPLHVASAMLSSSTGLLRRACLQAHSHPLQSKALELCFNVALNRLPTSTNVVGGGGGGLHHHHHHLPSLSNALVAAFKRAQAHQRRGSLENQQQPILALKVEIEQLVISILDDPSVSRVMREAGFSSTHLKNNVEQAHDQSKPLLETKPLLLGTPSIINHHFKLSLNETTTNTTTHDHDVIVTRVVDAMMMNKKKDKKNNIVIVAESLNTSEGILRGVIDKFDKGAVPGDMKYVQFISVPLYTLRNITRDEFEKKLGELRSLVKGYINRGVVLYLGDLQWVSEFWSKSSHYNEYYSPVEHMIMELSRLCGSSVAVGEGGTKLWIMGISTFNTFSKCKNGHPSLETLWDLHPISLPASTSTVPFGSLSLGLNFQSNTITDDLHRSKASGGGVDGKSGIEKQKLTCCKDCSANFNREARSDYTTFSTLPSWLQKYKQEHTSTQISCYNNQECNKVENLCKKWNSICSSVHKRPHFLDKAFIFSSSSSPSSSTSISSNDHLHESSSKLHYNSLLNFQNTTKSVKEHQFLIISCEKDDESKLLKPDLLSNPNSSPNSASSSEASGDHDMELLNNEVVNPEKQYKIVCSALEKKVPWQREIIPDIVSTIFECRSGKQKKEETWLFFLGDDSEGGKEKIAMELAKLVFGSEDSYISMGLSSFSSSTTSTEDQQEEEEEVISKKRSRDENGKSYVERFADALSENPKRVFFMEDVDQVEYNSQNGIKKAIQNGNLTTNNGEIVSFKDAIVIFSCDTLSSRDNIRQKEGISEISIDEKKPLMDLNMSIEDHVPDTLSKLQEILELVDKQIIFKVQVL